MSIYAKEFLAIFFAFKVFGHIFWGTPKPVIILTDNKSVTRFFQTKVIPPSLWNACDYVIQFNFTIAHIPGKNNTAADYLSRLEISPKEKRILRIREDIPTTPIELHVQSAGVAEEEQIYYTDDDDIRYQHYLRQLDRLSIQNDVIIRQNYDETGNIKYNQLLLPKHLVNELLESLHGKANRHPGIAKMLQEIRCKYYYPGIAKLVRKWVNGCETCIKDKRINNELITPELVNLPEWTLGPEDAMQIDLLPNLPPSGGYENIITAMDVFSRYLFAYPVADASAANTAKVIIDRMTKHTYLPTTLITDKGSAFTSKLVAEIVQILGIQIRCATTKHPQTIGKLERTHASLKTNLKMASGAYRRQWQKYLPLAVLNYNTSYHSTLGCEPSRIFHGRIPYNFSIIN